MRTFTTRSGIRRYILSGSVYVHIHKHIQWIVIKTCGHCPYAYASVFIFIHVCECIYTQVEQGGTRDIDSGRDCRRMSAASIRGGTFLRASVPPFSEQLGLPESQPSPTPPYYRHTRTSVSIHTKTPVCPNPMHIRAQLCMSRQPP